MPGETRIFKDTHGWYEVDNPGVYHATREDCRNARKARIRSNYAAARAKALHPAGKGTAPIVNTGGPVPHTKTPTINGNPLTSLQERLFNRMTVVQGVDPQDAVTTIAAYGYNAAASYGHMRAAGANHAEAITVIGLGLPDVSLAYGLSRAAGNDHTTALRTALHDYDTDD